MQPKVTVDPLLASVTLLQIMVTGRGPKPCKLSSATGFFFEYNSNRFLVTNLHAVISESEGQYPDHFIIQLHTSKMDVSQIREVRLELYDSRGERRWLQHQKGRGVDLAAINITDLLRDTDMMLSWTPEQLLPKGAKLGLGSEVLVVGYPMEFYDTKNNLPIVRTGTLASAYGMDFRGNPVCIVDANLEQGTSGSPVIVRTSPIGLSIDQSSDKKMTYSRGYMVGVNSGEYSAQSFGLYKVWYANLILDILS